MDVRRQARWPEWLAPVLVGLGAGLFLRGFGMAYTARTVATSVLGLSMWIVGVVIMRRRRHEVQQMKDAATRPVGEPVEDARQ